MFSQRFLDFTFSQSFLLAFQVAAVSVPSLHPLAKRAKINTGCLKVHALAAPKTQEGKINLDLKQEKLVGSARCLFFEHNEPHSSSHHSYDLSSNQHEARSTLL